MPLIGALEWEALRLSLAIALRSVVVSLPPATLVAWLLTRVRFPGALAARRARAPAARAAARGGRLPAAPGLRRARSDRRAGSSASFGIRLVFTREGAALATAVMSFPLMVRAIRLSLEQVDPGLEAAARTLGAGPLDRFLTITLPLITPGLLAGAITAFAAGLGEFGAVITFASNIPGETRTLPLALYTALQQPGGDAAAARLAAISFSLGLAGLLASESLARAVRRRMGR